MRLPEPWEREVADIKRRLENLERNDTTMREQLQSYNGEEEDSQVTIPTDAPPRAKVALGALAGLTPNGRLIVIVVAICALTLLVWRGVIRLL
jgi:hypothetical protein